MQPVPNGPDIPVELLHLHEEGKVVFFCGAGISRPAGLPGFRGLVEKVYARLAQKKDDIEKLEFKRKNYDRCLFLLEKRLASPDLVRNAVHSILTKIKSKNDIHATLLTLATTESGKTRLVTTNFDRLFEKARQDLPTQTYVAPLLPFVSHDDWNGVVYLHGLLPEDSDPVELRRVVMSSGDFGSAYLVDRWASRFLVELFTHYTVCFIGYSLDDPIVRYLTDSLDAARLHGERQIDHYAFCPEKETDSWRAKGIRPIGYKVAQIPNGKQKSSESHKNLYSALNAWCQSIRNGDAARTKTVEACACKDPRKNSPSDDFVGQLLWALDDPSGEAAKVFAKADVKHPFEWLEEFDRPRFNERSASLLPFPEGERQPSENIYSFLSRPILSPSGKRGFLSLSTQHSDTASDPISRSLADWFAKNLSDVRFFFWAIRQTGLPKRYFLRTIHKKLVECGKTDAEKDKPISDTLQFLWQLYLSGRTQTEAQTRGLYDTFQMLDEEIANRGWSPFALKLLREIATPLFCSSDDSFSGHPLYESDRNPVGYWTMNLSCVALLWQYHWDQWKTKLPNDSPRVLATVEQLLEDALSMMAALHLHDTDERFASIDLHSPNCNREYGRNLADLALLARIVRDAWMALAENNPALAAPFIERWIRSKYATFNRLALFASANTNCEPAKDWPNWLLESDGRILWLPVFRREVCRLFVSKGKELSKADAEKLVSAILTRSPIQKDWTKREIDEDVWVRLVKLSEGQVSLPQAVADKIVTLPKDHPALRKYEDQSEEFPNAFHSWNGDRSEDCQFIHLPDDENELLSWIENHSKYTDFDPSKLRFVSDDWQKKCVEHPDKCLGVLLKAKARGKQLENRWYRALSAWGQIAEPDAFVSRLSKEIGRFEEDEVLALAEPISSFLKEIAPKCKRGFRNIIDLSLHLLSLKQPDSKEEPFDPEFHSNYASIIAEMFVATLFPSKEKPGAVVSGALRRRMLTALEKACSKPSAFCPITTSGVRIALLKNANLLFENDRDWTGKHIVPLLKWSGHPQTALRNWNAFLFGSSFQLDLLREVKQDFLQVSAHLPEFQKSLCLHNYRGLVFWLARRRVRSFPNKVLRKCISRYDQPCLDDFFKRMERAAMHNIAKGEIFWQKEASRFLDDYLPVVSGHCSESISESLSVIAVCSGDQFPNALKMVEPYLRPVSGWYAIPASLDEAKQSERHPKESLELMLATIDRNSNFASIDELDRCLNAILERRPDLRLRAKPLREFSKKMHTILDP